MIDFKRYAFKKFCIIQYSPEYLVDWIMINREIFSRDLLSLFFFWLTECWTGLVERIDIIWCDHENSISYLYNYAVWTGLIAVVDKGKLTLLPATPLPPLPLRVPDWIYWTSEKKWVVFLCCAPNYSQKCVDVGGSCMCLYNLFMRDESFFSGLVAWLFQTKKLIPIAIPYDYITFTCI